MADLSITNESKNSIDITGEDKGNDLTWNEATFSWDDATGTWDTQRVVLTKETKNSLSITNENKN